MKKIIKLIPRFFPSDTQIIFWQHSDVGMPFILVSFPSRSVTTVLAQLHNILFLRVSLIHFRISTLFLIRPPDPREAGQVEAGQGAAGESMPISRKRNQLKKLYIKKSRRRKTRLSPAATRQPQLRRRLLLRRQELRRRLWPRRTPAAAATAPLRRESPFCQTGTKGQIYFLKNLFRGILLCLLLFLFRTLDDFSPDSGSPEAAAAEPTPEEMIEEAGVAEECRYSIFIEYLNLWEINCLSRV